MPQPTWVLLLTMSIPLWILMATSSRIMHHITKLKIIWFLDHDNEFTLLNWPPQSPDLNPIEHLWDVMEREIIMDVQPTNLQQLCDAIMSIWTRISEECFTTPCWIYARELRQFWRQKWIQPGTSKVYLIKWPMSVHCNVHFAVCTFANIL